jgi:extracellular factor (EF) 3-hydroxypalmitic acid methyl ester biosynthesis protein
MHRDALPQAPELLAEPQAALKAGHLHEMVDGLGRASAILRAQSGAEWQQALQQLRRSACFEVVQQDPLTRHAFTRPRGYPGDALLLDYIYGDWSVLQPPPPRSLGGRLYPWTYAGAAPTAVRLRRSHLAHLIDEAAVRIEQPRVLAIAAGHLREASLSVALMSGQVGEVVALDQDEESLAEVDRQAARQRLPITTVHHPIRNVIAGRCDLGRFDLVYAAGLYDYLETPVARRLTRSLFAMLQPGGRLVVANFTPQTCDRAYMEAFMDWWLIYRTQQEVEALDADIDPGAIARRHSYLCPTGNVAYLALRKAG